MQKVLDRAAPQRVRVVVCDDAPELRELLRIELEAEGDIEVLGMAGDANASVDLARRLRPDVVMLDLSMPGRSGLDVIGEILATSPLTSVVVLTGVVDDAIRARTLERGARRCLPKHTPAADLRTAVRQVAQVSPDARR
jgi:DNA-binding NarL/FixJ family response regulator